MRGTPVVGIFFSFIVGAILFAPFPGWQSFVGFVTSAAVLMYVFTPLAFAALRRVDPEHPRPFALRWGNGFAVLGFIAANLLVYWAGWGVVWRLMAVLGAGFILLAISYLTGRGRRALPPLDARYTLWLWPYLIGMAVISYLGQYGGGRGIIPLWWDVFVVALFSVGIFAWALVSIRPLAEVRASVAAEQLEVVEADEPGQMSPDLSAAGSR